MKYYNIEYKSKSKEELKSTYNKGLKFLNKLESENCEDLEKIEKVIAKLSAIANLLDKKDYFVPYFEGVKECGALK